MRLYRFGKLGSVDALQLQEAEVPRRGIGQVAVRIRACSLNHRDLRNLHEPADQGGRDPALRRRR
jgi:NADPH:quinone reductase-like Zn-dependent oxidoreductase